MLPLKVVLEIGSKICVIETSLKEGLAVVRSAPPAFAVVDMRLEDGNGLDVIEELQKENLQLKQELSNIYNSKKYHLSMAMAKPLHYFGKLYKQIKR